jgi:hypothetical protein
MTIAQKCVDTLKDYGDIVISLEKMETILNEDKRLLNEITINDMDTISREMLFDAFSMKYIGSRWPMYGDHEPYKTEFFRKLEEIKPNLV